MSLIPSSGRGALARFALAALIVVGFTATATAVAGLLQFKQLVTDLQGTPPIKHARVTIPNPGDAQTILIIGSDHRAGAPFSSANTDTMMLVRLDPNSSTINVISIPRDLKVQIPPVGGSTQKLNAAYSIGGPNLLIRVLKQEVFPDVRVNHIVDVNFGGFEALVNAIGCVYTDVDHRYYNNTALTNYSSINLQAGYQKLCGSDALSFVRFRHTDNDIVRSARQQDFIRWAKDQYGVGQLIGNRDKLLKIFGAHTETDSDLHTVDGLINLFNLVAFSAGHAIRQVPFPAILLPCGPAAPVGARFVGQAPCYVGADPGAERRVFRQFMTASQAPLASAAHPPGPSQGPKPPGPAPPNPTVAVPDLGDAKTQAAALGETGLPVYLPRLIAPGSSYEAPTAGTYPRAYRIQDQSGHSHSAYRVVLVLNPLLGQYYGVQGTTWQHAPILGSPTQTRSVNGKQLLLYLNGHKLSVVAWRTRQAAYWISNTLTDDLTNQQMVAIAASLSRT